MLHFGAKKPEKRVFILQKQTLSPESKVANKQQKRESIDKNP